MASGQSEPGLSPFLTGETKRFGVASFFLKVETWTDE